MKAEYGVNNQWRESHVHKNVSSIIWQEVILNLKILVASRT